MNGQSEVKAIKAGPTGTHYVTGTFTGTVTFGAFTLVSAGAEDVFVAQLDAAGSYLWVARAGGSNEDSGNDLALDSGGNVYVAGSFKSKQADFGSTLLTHDYCNGCAKTFVAKLSPTGTWLWAKQATADSYSMEDTATGLAVDATNNLYLTGSFSGRTLKLGSLTLPNSQTTIQPYSTGSPDLYVAKLSPTGTWLWAVSGGGTGYDEGVGIGLDATQNVYVTGYFESTPATFGGTGLPLTGDRSLLVAKLSPAGAWQWRAVGNGTGYTDPFGLAVAADGTSYLTGRFTGTTAFGANNVVSAGYFDAFVAKLSPAGTWTWAARSGGTKADLGTDIVLDGAGNAYVTGSFLSPTLDVGSTTLTNTSTNYDIFAARLDAQGTWQWGVSAGGGESDFGQALALDNQGGLYLAGYYTSAQAQFGPFTLTGNPSVLQGRVGYLAHLGNAVLSAQAAQPAASFEVYPNPSQGTLWLSGLSPGQAVRLYRVTGELVYAAVVPASPTTPLLLPTALASGLYVVRSGPWACKLQVQ